MTGPGSSLIPIPPLSHPRGAVHSTGGALERDDFERNRKGIPKAGVI